MAPLSDLMILHALFLTYANLPLDDLGRKSFPLPTQTATSYDHFRATCPTCIRGSTGAWTRHDLVALDRTQIKYSPTRTNIQKIFRTPTYTQAALCDLAITENAQNNSIPAPLECKFHAHFADRKNSAPRTIAHRHSPPDPPSLFA